MPLGTLGRVQSASGWYRYRPVPKSIIRTTLADALTFKTNVHSPHDPSAGKTAGIDAEVRYRVRLPKSRALLSQLRSLAVFVSVPLITHSTSSSGHQARAYAFRLSGRWPAVL